MPFLSSAWYVAAFSREVVADAPFARTLLDRPLVFYREPGGTVVALEDRCPHRFAPLSRGRLIDGALECPYHGLRFGAAGTCVLNPHGDGRVPAGARARCYPTRERYGAIWIWMGEAQQADRVPLPDFDFLDPERNVTSEGYLLTQANYQLSADNLLDLSHFQYLHPDTLGSDMMARGTVQSASEGDTVRVRRIMQGEMLRPFVGQAFGVPDGKAADRELDVRWQPPGLLTITVSVREAGAPPEMARVGMSAHWLTPETATRTHYFFAFGLPREMGEEGAALVQYSVEGLMKPFRDEDLPMLEAQQRAIGGRDFWSLRPAMLPIDAGAVRARRIMERLIADETALGDTAGIQAFEVVR
ncbi:(2Fe-2S)-binding protein [Paraburkholderia ginsengiterrae]|uniref:(2Fe-2S)-binding protein n=1 Tax=Paraburkholderia ginsengiterrae TaxID=1462993 RepID=A0A1A9NBI4_9BURK|nr:aromatic ring-hydroxylating dioxygenase subunit alpha [Paraburkholderia ginsengiterrae]OAJ61450.1 (2Fe-2S)-binding protein [Paraburkholderia ginsengiterrae]OAJ62854.1 (2Fe-2S)-binding protein [Paraburkholderia ginsengiterrae]